MNTTTGSQSVDDRLQVQEEHDTPRILPYRKWEEYFTFPSTGTLKYLLLRRKENGFDKCVRRISGRLYLDVPAVLQFLDSQRDV
jgi:hypothetical protein